MDAMLFTINPPVMFTLLLSLAYINPPLVLKGVVKIPPVTRTWLPSAATAWASGTEATRRGFATQVCFTAETVQVRYQIQMAELKMRLDTRVKDASHCMHPPLNSHRG